MKTSWSQIVVVFSLCVSAASANAPPGTEEVGQGYCKNYQSDRGHSFGMYASGFAENIPTVEECDQLCRRNDPGQGLRGFSYGDGVSGSSCQCDYEESLSPLDVAGSCPPDFNRQWFPCLTYRRNGKGPIDTTEDVGVSGLICYRYTSFPVGSPPSTVTIPGLTMNLVGQASCDASCQHILGPFMGHFALNYFASIQNAGYDVLAFIVSIQSVTTPSNRRILQSTDGVVVTYDVTIEYRPDAGTTVDENQLVSLPFSQEAQRTQFVQQIKNDEPATFPNLEQVSTGDTSGPSSTESNGDPHFRTWKNEHFEFHGQCDIVMVKVKDFVDQGIDLHIHLRTKMVRFWSYIQSAAIRIGHDILEVQGRLTEGDAPSTHWINYEPMGNVTSLSDFPVTIQRKWNKFTYTVDLDSVYPDQKIEIKTFKEFVGVKIINASEESFGTSVGITGDFASGKTFGRDGVTDIHDFTELGNEWQVLPGVDEMLFHDVAKPQFPELCYLPEDPRGKRRRLLGESSVTEQMAEEACAGLEDEFDRKGCVYDILATQDMDMVGAY